MAVTSEADAGPSNSRPTTRASREALTSRIWPAEAHPGAQDGTIPLSSPQLGHPVVTDPVTAPP